MMIEDINQIRLEDRYQLVPDALKETISELEHKTIELTMSRAFLDEFGLLLKNYAGRHTPFYRAQKISEKYGVELMLKREDLTATGSHHLTNALGQVLLAKWMGKKQVATETGSGHHGVAVATACRIMNIPCTVFMGAKDIKRQSLNAARIKILGAKLVEVTAGAQTSKAAMDALMVDWQQEANNMYYASGSDMGPGYFMSHVGFFQSVIGKEVEKQSVETFGSIPDYILCETGRGSCANGLFQPFFETPVKLVGAQATGRGVNTGKTSAALLSGVEGILHHTPTLVLKNETGEIATSHSIAPGMDYPAALPCHVKWKKEGRVTYIGVNDFEAMEAAYMLMDLEGIVPSLEAAHALALLKKISFTANDKVVVCISGSGQKDAEKYLAYQDVMN